MNSRRPTQIAVSVLDGAGRLLPDTGLRFSWLSSDTVPGSAHGQVTCARRADATLRAALGDLELPLQLRCRPVQTLRFSGPVQLVLGEPSRAIPVTAYGPDNRPVDLLAGSVRVGDTSLVVLTGLRVRPKRVGASILTVSAGGVHATTGLHVYAPVASLDELEREPRLVAVPLQLSPGEFRRWSLPWGRWMLSMWPEEDEGRGLALRVEGASCTPTEQISRRRYLCSVTERATVIVYAPPGAGAKRALTGTLAVKPSGEMRRMRRTTLPSVSDPR